MMSSTSISYQSRLTVSSGSAVGLYVKPKVIVSAISGSTSGLPPVRTAHWAAGHCVMLPYWPAVTPVRAHCSGRHRRVRPRAGVNREHRSVGHRLRVEQLDQARRTDRVVEGAAEPDALDRRPLQAELVGVDAARQLVVRVPVAGLEHEVLGTRHALQERNAELDVHFRHVGVRVDRRARAAAARQVTGTERLVRQEPERVAAVFGTDRNADAFLGRRQLQAVGAKIAGDVCSRRLPAWQSLGQGRTRTGNRSPPG